MVPNTRELVICQLCQHRQGGFNPAVRFPNKSVCYLCSNLTFSKTCRPARICYVHAMKTRAGPSASPCCVCRQTVFLANVGGRGKSSSSSPGVAAFGPVPAQLCQFCGFGIHGKSCCEFKDLLE